MNFRIQMTQQANADMRGLYVHIAHRLLEPQTAQKQYERIKSGILSLHEMPERFALFPDEPWRSRGLRRLVVDHFLVFYLVDTEHGIVTVLRVLYGGQDILSHLRDTPIP